MLQLPMAELDVRPGQVLSWQLADRPRHRAPGAVSYNQEDQFTMAWALREAADPVASPVSLAVDTFEIRGAPDRRALGAALLHFVRRHEALRCSFRRAAEEVMCGVLAARDVVLECRDHGRPESPDALRTVLKTLFRKIDIVAGPLFVLVAVLRECSGTVCLAFDHSVYDGLSAAIAVRDVATAYASYVRGTEPELPDTGSYVAFSRAQRRRNASLHAEDARLEYWKRFVTPDGGLCPSFPLDLGLAAGRLHPAVNRTDRLLTADGARALEARCRAMDGGLFAGALAALGICVRDEGGPDTFAGFMAVSERGRGPYAHAMGWCANAVPVRFSVAADRDRAEIVAGAQTACTAALRSAAVPFMPARQLLTSRSAALGTTSAPPAPCAVSYIDYTRAPGARRHIALRARQYIWLSHSNGLCLWLHRTTTGLYVNIVHADTPRARHTITTLRHALARTLHDMAASPAE